MICPHCHHVIPDAPAADAARRLAALRSAPGRKRSAGERCPCGEMTAKRAKARGHKCEAVRPA